MNLKDIMTLKQISETYEIPLKTLQSRLKFLVQDEDYRSLGKGQSTILSPQGIEKIIKKR